MFLQCSVQDNGVTALLGQVATRLEQLAQGGPGVQRLFGKAVAAQGENGEKHFPNHVRRYPHGGFKGQFGQRVIPVRAYYRHSIKGLLHGVKAHKRTISIPPRDIPPPAGEWETDVQEIGEKLIWGNLFF